MSLTATLYKSLLKPAMFMLDPELVHDIMTETGHTLGKISPTYTLLQKWLSAKSRQQTPVAIDGITLPNPVGLAAGFDYTGKMARVMKAVGFGFNTVGTVTAQYYEGNTKPRLGRLPKSQSLLVNKGFKSPGANGVKAILDEQDLNGHIIGISAGSSNIPEVDTIEKAIQDYCVTIDTFKDTPYSSYFEINISCPNARISEQFAEVKTLDLLLSEISKLGVTQPLWLKMANEITTEHAIQQMKTAMKYGVKTFILSNLVKHRDNPSLNEEEIVKIASLKGNFSGKPTQENSNRLIKETKTHFGHDIDIIGLGGIFSAEDAILKMELGASAVQLITGMIYEGPQVIGDIVRGIYTWKKTA